MHAHFQRQPQLGADAIGAGDQHRLAVVGQRQLEQRAEAPQPGQHAGTPGARRERLDAVDEGVAGVDIDAGILVAERRLAAV